MHTRVILKSRNEKDFFYREVIDFGIPYTEDFSEENLLSNEEVERRVNLLKRRYEVVKISARVAA